MKKKTQKKNYKTITIEQFMEIVSNATKKAYIIDIHNEFDDKIEDVNFTIEIHLENKETNRRIFLLIYRSDDADMEGRFVFEDIFIDSDVNSIVFCNIGLVVAEVFICPPPARTVSPESLLG